MSGNFIGLASSTYFNEGGVEKSAELDGILFAISKVQIRDIKDGTSSTAMVTELILSADTSSHDIRGRYYNPATWRRPVLDSHSTQYTYPRPFQLVFKHASCSRALHLGWH